ncbi:MAG: hypothetical protein U5Q03_04205 [Bacteroidota bacterium]|nr:hypothetical protein [Bacteroidota bacterium]
MKMFWHISEKGKSNIEFAHEVFEYIKDRGECVALAFDVVIFLTDWIMSILKYMWGSVINKYRLL